MGYYIRQLLIGCKDDTHQQIVCDKIKELTKIDSIYKASILKCVDSSDYEYVNMNFDYSVMLYFKNYNDIEKYCSHILHLDFVKNMLSKIDIVVFEYYWNCDGDL